MKIEREVFWENMDMVNRIGQQDDGGITRLALSDEDMKARDFIKEKCKGLGLKVWEDGVGNIRARKEGRDPTLPALLVGSHLDTVPHGGKYDGTLGVIAAIETVRMIGEKQINHRHPIEIIVFSTEESSRFNISTVGSKAITGKLAISMLKNYTDKNNISLYDALIDRGYMPETIQESLVRPENTKAFVELHIEQGPILEREQIQIGIVEAIAAPMRLHIHLAGEEAHSGSCPMSMRKDALTAAAEIILEIEKVGRDESKYQTVTTTGNCEVFPGAMNVVPGQVNLFVDVRGIHIESVLRTLNTVIAKTSEICNKRKVNHQLKVLSQERPVMLDQKMMDVVKEKCKKLGLAFKQMSSGAGHDTMNMAKVVPSSLIFIPCKKGISHNKNEDVKVSDIENGIKILFETVLELAK
ncbi:Zn-dependent hydrolase [Clostridiaceae bacterium 35-E11]